MKTIEEQFRELLQGTRAGGPGEPAAAFREAMRMGYFAGFAACLMGVAELCEQSPATAGAEVMAWWRECVRNAGGAGRK